MLVCWHDFENEKDTWYSFNPCVLLPDRRVAPMSETERKINDKLLKEVQDWKSTGKLST